MENKIGDFFSCCSHIDFGPVDLSGDENEFYKGFNHEIISLCDSLPESIQLDALFFFKKYAGLTTGRNFFKNYYVPSWSIIYWLIRSDSENGKLTKEDIKNSRTAHAMALKLHSLDDHMNDKEIPATHLTLLLRSQSWMIMMNAFEELADGVGGGHEIVRGFINDYYSAICDPEEIESLDNFCSRFRKEMATWLIVPVLMTKRITNDQNFTEAIQMAYGSFGIAWKLLDDIMDIKMDMKNSMPSSVYICLPENIKKLWNKNATTGSNHDSCHCDAILNCIKQQSVMEKIQQRISMELKSAAAIFENHRMGGLAKELRSLSRPFSGQNFLHESKHQRRIFPQKI
ncbi:MAG: hypothetical protein LJE96_12735 [Deltaproteobacteria bacterium]|nr:hypothetical protein [Deltaproteobacteria bacterium]